MTTRETSKDTTFEGRIDALRVTYGPAFDPLIDALDALHREAILEPRVAPRLLNRREAAKRLGIGVSTFDLLVQKGRLPPVLLPSGEGTTPLKRWDPISLDRFIAERAK